MSVPISLLSLTLLLVTSLRSIPLASASSNAPSSLPQVDFSRMGSVGIAGSFAGLDFYAGSGSGTGGAGGYSSEADSLIQQDADGTMRPVGNTNTNGRITTLCWSSNHPLAPSSSTSSSNNGTVYLGGNFSSIGGVDALNVAAYDLGSGTFSALAGMGSGVDGPVEAVYCDDTDSRVWIGGEFDGPSAGSTGASMTGNGTYEGNMVIFSEAAGAAGFQPVPFAGLNGGVRTIVPSADGKSIYFGGSFTTTFVTTSSSSTSTNGTATTSNGTGTIADSAGSSPAGTVTTGFSGYLTPIPMTASSVNLTAGPTTTIPGYTDPSILLCPSDGEAWLGRDNSIVNINVLTNKQVRASGVRIGNGLVQGRGTTEFRLVTIPDNTVQTLTYLDPASGANMTCSTTCPLSTNTSVMAQDFLFPAPMDITGYQVVLLEWEGSAAGLSRLQLLSSGSAVHSVSGDNADTCSTGSTTIATNVQTSGSWETCTSTTEIAGTTQRVLYIDVPIGSSDQPSVTYSPYVASGGFYQVSALIPGCLDMSDCDSRSSVDIVVQPYAGAASVTTTVSESVQQNTYASVYSGYVQASDSSFQPTIKMTLAATPAEPRNSNLYEVVAGSIVLTFYSAATQSSNGTWVEAGVTGNANVTAGSMTNSTSSVSRTSFGVFDWVLADAAVNAAGILSNATETQVDMLGFALSEAMNATSAAGGSRTGWEVNDIALLNGNVYIGGSFTRAGNLSNVLTIAGGGGVTPLGAEGLNGPINSIAVLGSYIYVGGNFTATASSGGSTLNYMARYDPSGQAWSSMAGGVDGPVTDIVTGTDGTSLIVTGNFSRMIGANGNSTASGGFAVYDTEAKSWSTANTGLLFGNVTDVVVTGKAANQATFVGGRIAGASSNSADGIAMLTGSGANAVINTLGVDLSPTSDSTSTSAMSRRGHSSGRAKPLQSSNKSRSWMNLLSNVIHKRALTTAPALPAVSTTSPSILAGAFWTNSSASGSPTITIFGGDFTRDNPAVSGLGFCNSQSGELSGAYGAQIDGAVRTLTVVANDLYVGGRFTLGSNIGLAVYDLAGNTWQSGVPALSGSAVNVSSIASRSGTTTIIVAGHFDGAGSLACPAICSWDTAATRWTTLGSGLQSGEIRSIAFAGANDELLIVAGSFVLSDNTVAYVASYSFANSTWTSLGLAGDGEGQLPGPVTAMTVDNLNTSSIFASGLSTADGSPFLSWWNGVTWTEQNSTLQTGSSVEQLVMVPLAEDHAATGSMEMDRMLMVSGSLALDGIGSVSTALFDGKYWHPYLTSLTSTGAAGTASALFYSQSSFSFSSHLLKHSRQIGGRPGRPVAIAIATGLMFLLVLLGLLFVLWRRRSDRNKKAVPMVKETTSVNSETSSDHARRLDTIQRAVFGGAGGAALGTSLARRKEKVSPASTPRSSFGDGSFDSHGNQIGPTAGAAAVADRGPTSADTHESSAFYSDAPSELGRPTRVKFDFVAQESAELSVMSGDEVHVIEEDEHEDGHGWVLARTADGRQGVVPASYIW